jgi:thiol-disulfide isomerase/thioredoxin
MKKTFFLITILLPLLAFSQTAETFTIKGKIGDQNARIYLFYQLGANRVVDSAQMTNGNFNFTGNVINPSDAFLIIDHKGVGINKLDSTADVLSLYVDKGEMTITGRDSAAKATVTGSKINDDNIQLLAQLRPVIDRAKRLHDETKHASRAELNSAEFQKTIQEKYKALQADQKAILKNFILSHPDSYLSLLALNSVAGPSPEPNEIDPLYNSLSKRLKDTETAKMLEKALDGLRSTAIGSIAPDFVQNDVSGVPVRLSSFRGKYVLLDFWASWCGPCREENPNVVRAYNKYKDKNFTIISVSLDKPEGRDSWLAAIKYDGLRWTQVSDLKFWNNEAAALYKVTSIPSNFLIDPIGKIVAKNLRGSDLDDKLDEVLVKSLK